MRERVGPYGWAAPLYRAAGWAGVLPLPAGRKVPPPKLEHADGTAVSFTGRHGIDPTAAQIRAWVRTRSDGNVALRLPFGVSVACVARRV